MSEFFKRLPKRIFLVCLVFSALGGAFLYGALAYRNKLPPIPQLLAGYRIIANLSETGLKDSAYLQHLQPARGQGNGVTVNKKPDDGALVFMTGFFDEENQIRLIRRDGTLVRKWSLDYFEHFPNPESRVCDLTSSLRVDIHGSLATPQGEVIFNYEQCGSVKLDDCGEIIWRVNKPTHHSLVPAAAGGYWLLARHTWPTSEQPDRFPPFSSSTKKLVMDENTILRISEDGEILEEFSIPELMHENNLEALLTAAQRFELDSWNRTELVHANKVSELPAEIADAYPIFNAGDLAVSMRGLNLIIVLDPATKKIKWHQTGPWLRQHDPEFRPDGRISVFNNNVYRTAYDGDQTVLSTPRRTNIIAVDPVTRKTEVLFGERPGQEMLSVIRGQHELLDDNGMLITEFDAGRVLEVDTDGQIVWEYVNRYNDEFVGEITNSAIYPADYFQAEWKACGQ